MTHRRDCRAGWAYRAGCLGKRVCRLLSSSGDAPPPPVSAQVKMWQSLAEDLAGAAKGRQDSDAAQVKGP